MDKRSNKNYKALAFTPMLTFLELYVGCGVVFAIMGTEGPSGKASHYVTVMAAIVIAMIFYDGNTPIGKKVDIYCKGAGSSGIMLLGIIVLMTDGFSSAAATISGRESIVSMSLTSIPFRFLIPGIFIVTCFISTYIGTSMGTQVVMVSVAIAVAQGAGLSVAMTGAAVIAGTYFNDSLFMISDTTICATKGVGTEMKDKFRMNFLIALPATMITIVLYSVLGANGSGPMDTKELHYSMLEVPPYLTILVTATAGLDVFLVLLISILTSGVIGIVMSTVTFFEWVMAIGARMEEMFFLVVFSMLMSGPIKLIKYYGGAVWLVKTITEKIKNRKGYGCLISLVSMAISGTTLNNPVAIIITASVAKELGSKYRIASKRPANLLNISSYGISMLVSHDSSVLLVQQYGGVAYLEIVRFAFYPILLILFACITIQFGLLRIKEERESGFWEEETVIKQKFLQTYLVERCGTDRSGWDSLKEKLGEENLPAIWVADMESKTCDEAVEAMIERT